MVMATLGGVTVFLSLLTGISGIIGGVLRRKGIVLITTVLIIFSTAIVTFIGLYSLSGVIETDGILEKGWKKMDEEQIKKFEEVWNCHGFNENDNLINSTSSESETIEIDEIENNENSESSDNLDYCVDRLRDTFFTYSSVVLSVAVAFYLILLSSVMMVSHYLIKEQFSKEGFESLGGKTEQS